MPDQNGWFGGLFNKTKRTNLDENPSPPPVIKAQGQLNDREILETEVIKLLLQSYFSIVKRTLSDMVPKAIMFYLVNYSKENMQKELLSQIYRDSEALNLLEESADVRERREELKKTLGALRKAEKIVNSV
eukprot:NODE_350_length_8989_cov_0.477684.p6 type:complete len:131 gc:universal NODE_350_length_8989_cov_0.477684:2820-3212(+)